MSKIDNENVGIEGDRSISSVASAGGRGGGQSNTQKSLVLIAMIIFVGVVAFLNFGGEEAVVVEDDYRPPTRVGSGTFAPAEIPLDQPAVAPAIEVVEPAPEQEQEPTQLGPIERVRVEVAEPVEPTREELLFDVFTSGSIFQI